MITFLVPISSRRKLKISDAGQNDPFAQREPLRFEKLARVHM